MLAQQARIFVQQQRVGIERGGIDDPADRCDRFLGIGVRIERRNVQQFENAVKLRLPLRSEPQKAGDIGTGDLT